MSSLNNAELSDGIYIDKILKNIQNRFSLTDYEINLLKEINNLLRKPLPTVQVGIESRVSLIDSYRIKLVNLIYNINDSCSTHEYEYKKEYDPEFTRLTRAGRPSQASIDSEIHTTHQNLRESRQLLVEYEDFKNLLYSYLKTMDSCKETCLKKWGRL